MKRPTTDTKYMWHVLCIQMKIKYQQMSLHGKPISAKKYQLTYKWKSNINKYQWTLFEVGATNWLIEITDKQKHTYQLVKPGSTKNQKHSYKMPKNY